METPQEHAQQQYTTLAAIVAALERCHFLCEGGALDNHLAFRQLKVLAYLEEQAQRQELT